MLLDLKIVKLICDLIANEPKLAIKEEAIRVAAAILLGGNQESQRDFANYIKNDTGNMFMLALAQMLKNAFDKITVTQDQRNAYTFKKKSTEKRIKELKAEKERYSGKMGKPQLK